MWPEILLLRFKSCGSVVYLFVCLPGTSFKFDTCAMHAPSG